MATETDIEKTFELLQKDSNHHLGLGDIRLTIGQQEDIIKLFRLAQKKSAKKVRYAAIEIVQDYDHSAPLGELINSICRDIQNIEV